MNPKNLLSLAVLAATGCIDRPSEFDVVLNASAPVVVGTSLVYLDAPTARARVVTLSTPESPGVRVLAVGANPTLIETRAGTPASAPEALVLSRGRRDEVGVSPEPGSLTALAVGDAPTARRYVFSSPYNAMAQSPDGRFVLAHYRPSSSADRLLFNPNEISLIDLAAAPGAANPSTRTVRSFGGIPNRVVFAPTLNIGGVAHQLALVFSDAYVTLIDLNNPQRNEITVRLTLPEDPRAILPQQAVFDLEGATIYLRAQSSNDIYALRLEPVTPMAASDNDYRPSINQLAAGQNPSDMALIGEPANRRLLVVSPGSVDARVIDARANTTLRVPLSAQADKILLFEGVSPRENAVRPRALLYATNGVTAVSFLELNDLEARQSQNVELVPLQRSISTALPLLDRGVVLFGHPTEASAAGRGAVSLLDLGRRTAAPIFSEVPLGNARFDHDRTMLWVAPQSGERLGYIDLRSFRPGELRLDGVVRDVIPLGGGAGARSRVVALHEARDGWVTVLDASDPQRSTARSVRGFLLSNLLSIGAE